MKHMLQRWLDITWNDIPIRVLENSMQGNKEQIAVIQAQIQVLRIELQDLKQSVQQLVNENIELRKNLPNKPARQARNFTEFKSLLEATTHGSETI